MLWQWSKSVSTRISYTLTLVVVVVVVVVHAWLTVRPLETYSGPDFQIQRRGNSRRPQPLQTAWISITFFFFFFGFESFVSSINVVDWCHFFPPQMVDVSFWNPSLHLFRVIETWRRGLVKGWKAAKKSGAKTLKNARFEVRVCATLWIIPTALNTDVRCSPEVTKKKILFSVETGDM